MPGHLKKQDTIPKDTILKLLASPIFCPQYMMSSDLIFSMDLRISFKQKKNVFVCPSIAGYTDPTRIPIVSMWRFSSKMCLQFVQDQVFFNW